MLLAVDLVWCWRVPSTRLPGHLRRKNGVLVRTLQQSSRRRGAWAAIGSAGAASAAFAIGGGGGLANAGTVPGNWASMWPRLAGWAGLFCLASFVHAAEIAITTLWPWKVREFAEEEGEKSPFARISESLTPVMTAMLVASTVFSVCATTLATSALGAMFGNEPRSLAAAGAGLAAITIFFGELVPKTLGVYCAEPIARAALPHLIRLAFVLAPVGNAFSLAVKALVTPLGWRYDDDAAAASVVSEGELRLLVAAAGQSGSIDAKESSMVESVLDLQDTKVSEVMTPRVEVVAVDVEATVAEALEIMTTTKYSRLPVYVSDVDNVTAVVLAKSLIKTYKPLDKGDPRPVPLVARRQDNGEEPVVVGDLALEPTYFVPESMSVWAALEAMRRRRCHLAVVVDEYGGTAGIVTLEDILEEIVGEIYDEEDALEGADVDDLKLIQIMSDEPGAFLIRGEAELDDVRAALFPEIYFDTSSEEQDDNTGSPSSQKDNNNNGNKKASGSSSGSSLKPLDGELYDCVTLSGLLCAVRGEIPEVGDLIEDSGFVFQVEEADDRRVLQVKAWRPAPAIFNRIDDGDSTQLGSDGLP